MATLSIKSPKTSHQIWSEMVAYGKIPANETEHTLALNYLVDGDKWTLEEYIEWINHDSQGFELMGADAWRERGILTASALGDYLDAENARNLRKEAMYG